MNPKLFFRDPPNLFDLGEFLPTSLLRKIVFDHLPTLKAMDEHLHVPHFWRLLDDKHISLVQELVQTDPSLLDLKTREGFTILDFLQWYPGDNKIRKFVGSTLKKKSN